MSEQTCKHGYRRTYYASNRYEIFYCFHCGLHVAHRYGEEYPDSREHIEIGAFEAQYDAGTAMENDLIEQQTTRLAARINELETALRDSDQTASNYRLFHDAKGDDSVDAGRAWGQMRTAHERAVAALAHKDDQQ